MSLFSRVLRAGEGKKLKALQSLVPDINALEPEIEALSDEALRHKTVEFRERLANVPPEDMEEGVNDLLLEAFAVSREAARRVIGQRHFDVQLMGGAALPPLIISGRVDDAAQLYYKFAGIVRTLTRDVDYDVDEEKRTVAPTEAGIEKVERALGVENLYDELSANFVHQLQAALRAKELYKRDVDYVVQNGEAKIVDEFTGRILEGRRWSEGLHQAVEAKERVRIKEENQTLATITLQNYFRMYDKLAGMTGTALTEAGESAHTYTLAVVPSRANPPRLRHDQVDPVHQ